MSDSQVLLKQIWARPFLASLSESRASEPQPSQPKER